MQTGSFFEGPNGGGGGGGNNACCNPWSWDNNSVTSAGSGSSIIAENIASSSSSRVPKRQSTTTTTTTTHGIIDDAALAKEMNELSVEERNKVFDDIHGVAEVLEEPPHFLNELYKQLDAAITKLPGRRRKHLNRAFFLCPKLETDTKFKLMFLRADLYDATKAADRMAKYFDLKCELFGEEKLVKRITIQDLNEDDLYFIKCGFNVGLPVKDPSGRPLFFVDISRALGFSEISIEGMLRCSWYMTMAAVLDDDRAQKIGICSVLYNSGNYNSKPGLIGRMTESARRNGYMTSCLPCRYTSLRLCYAYIDPVTELFTNSLRLALGKSARLRLGVHLGSDLELEYFLMTFGIRGCEDLFQNARKGDMILHEQYIQKRAEIDYQLDSLEQEQEAMTGNIAYPNSNDVLFGRGAPYNISPGNRQWEQLIATHVNRYAESNNFDKTCISMEMIKTVHEYGGQFLQRTVNGWKALDDASAREKAARAFRTRMKSAAQQLQNL